MIDFLRAEWVLVAIVVLLLLGPEDGIRLARTIRRLVGHIRHHLQALWKACEPSSSLPSTPRVHLALYHPEIPHNTGTLLRLSACLGVPLHIIEPCSFLWDNQYIKRSAMDYIDFALSWRHADWESFREHVKGQRIILLTTQARTSYRDITFQPHDVVLCGRESDGVPEAIAHQCDASVVIPMRPPCRSLNMAIAATLVIGEALRQLDEGVRGW